MRTLAQKQKRPKQTKPTLTDRAHLRQSRGGNSILHLQRTIGNQGVQRLLETHAVDANGDQAAHEPGGLGHYFSRIPAHASVQRSIQPKLKVGSRGDSYEQEADQVADQVMHMKHPETSSAGPAGSHSTPQDVETHIQPGSSLGEPLDIGINDEMSRNIGVDFSNVRIHTDEPAAYLNTRLNARAFTYGSDIFFNKGEYDPHSSTGKKLLAHELTHVVQQSRMGDSAQRQMIQCTTIGAILDEFFSPFSSETLWVMPQSDNYTRIVRRWQPVIDAVTRAKANLEANCAHWSANRRTDSSWAPGKTDPPVTDPNAHREFVPSPPGTDPDTCKNAFIIYVTTKANPVTPTIQTFELYTCSIGSFNIYATVDGIDCAATTARMNVWMYNAMSRRSFGRYASHPLFVACGMEKQYMWWNWKETHNWGSTPAPGGGGGGSSGWG